MVPLLPEEGSPPWVCSVSEPLVLELETKAWPSPVMFKPPGCEPSEGLLDGVEPEEFDPEGGFEPGGEFDPEEPD